MVYARRLELADEGAREKIVVDVFTALLGVFSICALAGAILKIFTKRPKAWDDDWFSGEIETPENYNELRKENPHIWLD